MTERRIIMRLIPGTICAVLLAASLSAGCAYTNIRRPLGQEFDKTELGTKEGQSHARSVLWLVAWGDAGTKAAAENGGIKIIRHADTEVYSILLGLYTRLTTVVYGD